MRIALDATYSLGRELTGVGVYSREICFGLALSHPETRFSFCYRPHRFFKSLRESLPSNATRSLLFEFGPFGRASLFHGLNQRAPMGRPMPTVTTFHDLFVMTGEYSTPEFRARFTEQARNAASRSDLIICVSAFTAGQVRDLLSVPSSKLRVIHHGVRVEPAAARVREPIVLSVGAIQRRKNTARLVDAFARTKPGWRLVLAGSSGYGAGETLAAIEKSGRAGDIEVTGYVSTRQLDRLYRTASIFAFPSLDEGFGIPVLEAMSHRLPVLVSTHPVFREVCGEAALFADPADTDSLSSALQQLMDDSNLRGELADKGQRRSEAFTWERAVDQTWQVYRELSPRT